MDCVPSCDCPTVMLLLLPACFSGYNCTGDMWTPITERQMPLNCTRQAANSTYSPPSPAQQPGNQWDRDKLRLVQAALGNPPFLASWDLPYDMPCGSPQWDWLGCWDGAVADINWSDMGLVGTLPQEFGLLRGLQRLDLSQNSFNGPVPSTWGANGTWMSLRELNLSSNLLTGALPVGLRGAGSLETLDLSFNSFSVRIEALCCCTTVAVRPAASSRVLLPLAVLVPAVSMRPALASHRRACATANHHRAIPGQYATYSRWLRHTTSY